jgi:hypothetical protein
MTDFDIKPATYSFECPACGKRTMPGENCVNLGGVKTCTCALPALPSTSPRERRLIPMAEYIRKYNLKTKLDLQVLQQFPNGKAASKILKQLTN